MASASRFPSSLLHHLYDAVLHPAGFQPFIEALQAAFDVKAVCFIVRNTATHEVRGLWLSGMAMEWMKSYALDYAGEDLLAGHIMASPIAHFYASNLDIELGPGFLDSRFYNEWLQPQGVACAAGAVVIQEGPWLTQLILQRSPVQPPFARDELDALDELMPHLQRSIQLRQRFAELALGQNFLSGGLDVLAMPTLLLDEHGLVAHINRTARVLLGSGGPLRLAQANLVVDDTAIARKLAFAVSTAVRASRGEDHQLDTVVLVPRAARLPLMLMVSPLPLSGAQRSHGGALLFVFDPDIGPLVTVDTVRRLFQLSEAEAALAAGLCRGKSLDELAEERGTSIHTVKSQLKSVFLKTGTKRQSELVSLLLASPACFLAAGPEAARVPGVRDNAEVMVVAGATGMSGRPGRPDMVDVVDAVDAAGSRTVPQPLQRPPVPLELEGQG